MAFASICAALIVPCTTSTAPAYAPVTNPLAAGMTWPGAVLTAARRHAAFVAHPTAERLAGIAAPADAGCTVRRRIIEVLVDGVEAGVRCALLTESTELPSSGCGAAAGRVNGDETATGRDNRRIEDTGTAGEETAVRGAPTGDNEFVLIARNGCNVATGRMGIAEEVLTGMVSRRKALNVDALAGTATEALVRTCGTGAA